MNKEEKVEVRWVAFRDKRRPWYGTGGDLVAGAQAKARDKVSQELSLSRPGQDELERANLGKVSTGRDRKEADSECKLCNVGWRWCWSQGGLGQGDILVKLNIGKLEV